MAISLAIPAGMIVILHLVMYTGLVIAKRRERAVLAVPGSDPGVCVVVPARNEERLLSRLLDSIAAQTVADFRVLLVDDRSSDRTGEIMDDFASQHPDRTTVIHIDTPSDIGNPKLAALIRGVDEVTDECILFTDADCVLPPAWVESMRRSFRDERVAVVLGPIETLRSGAVISHFHAFDHIFKYAYNAGCAGIDQATGGFGNNLAVRSSALREIGGMSAIAVSVTEDAALVSAVRERTSYRVIARFSREVTVLTEPQPDLKQLTEQEVRWHTGGLFAPDAFSRLSYRFIMFYLTASVLVIPIIPFLPVLAILPAVSFLTMSGIALFAGVFTRQRPVEYWLPFPAYILTEMVYDSLLTIFAMTKPTLVWKGESIRRARE